jgi:putative ABC transport system permease protein
MVSLTFDANRTGQVLGHVRETWAAMVPDRPLDYFFLDDDFARQYRREERTTALFSTFAGLGIFVACLGLVGLASFLAEKRTKEIGVRKVLGASPARIAALFVREFMLLVVLASALAWPAAYLLMGRWLRNFAYRVEMGPWTFILSAGAAFAVALLTISAQTMRAVLADPVKSIRYE